jgi:hypothetical protein
MLCAGWMAAKSEISRWGANVCRDCIIAYFNLKNLHCNNFVKTTLRECEWCHLTANIAAYVHEKEMADPKTALAVSWATRATPKPKVVFSTTSSSLLLTLVTSDTALSRNFKIASKTRCRFSIMYNTSTRAVPELKFVFWTVRIHFYYLL